MRDQGRENTFPEKREPLTVYVRHSVQAEFESHTGRGSVSCLLQLPWELETFSEATLRWEMELQVESLCSMNLPMSKREVATKN